MMLCSEESFTTKQTVDEGIINNELYPRIFTNGAKPLTLVTF